MKLFKNKRCPRCNNKCAVELVSCPTCQLNFNKFNEATNKEAKIAIREGRKEDCLLRSGRPSDVKWWKLLLIAVFLGFAGGHNYYVGRYKRGIWFSVFFVCGLINAILTQLVPNLNTQSDLWQVFYVMVLGWGAVMVLWIIDVANIVLNKFRIPVSRNV